MGGSSENVLIEEAGAGGGYSRVVGAVNALMVSGERAPGKVPMVGEDGKVGWETPGEGPSGDYIPTAQKGAANGVAPLDADSRVPSANSNIRSIEESTTIYVATTGSDSTGNGSAEAPYASIHKALACLSKTWMAADVIISVGAGAYTLTENLVVNHPQSRRTRIIGAAPITTALSGNIGAVSGASGNWSITVNVADASGIAVGDYVMFHNLAGGTNPTLLYGCHAITGISGNAITINTKSITASSPSGAVTGTLIALKTRLSGSGVLLDIVSGLRALRQIALINAGTTAGNFCVQVRPSEALLNIGYLGLANANIGMLVGMRAALEHPLTESPAGQVNAISGCATGLYVSGGGANGQQLHVSGCTTGITATSNGIIVVASSFLVGNTTASSPANNTDGNSNSYISQS